MRAGGKTGTVPQRTAAGDTSATRSSRRSVDVSPSRLSIVFRRPCLLYEKLGQPALGKLPPQPRRARHSFAGTRMKLVPYLGPQGEAQLGTRPSLCLCVFVVDSVASSGPRELDPAPVGTMMTDVPLAHRAA